jgi:hypothetical protein
MTTIAHHAWASVRFYWRGQLGLALAVATVTATLVGALVVGSSMRGSLKEMTLQRLQRIDEVWLAEHFFSRDSSVNWSGCLSLQTTIDRLNRDLVFYVSGGKGLMGIWLQGPQGSRC